MELKHEAKNTTSIELSVSDIQYCTTAAMLVRCIIWRRELHLQRAIKDIDIDNTVRDDRQMAFQMVLFVVASHSQSFLGLCYL